jgi:hypothetical protein
LRDGQLTGFEERGFALAPSAIPADERRRVLDGVAAQIPRHSARGGVRLRSSDGFGPWSSKEGVTHVQPPVGVLERMVAVRLHLDDCAASNGPLRVIPGSHASGRLSAAGIAAIRAREPECVCVARAGDPARVEALLLHASSAATAPGHRRVLHVEYACEPLPAGMDWFEQCA